MILERNDKWSRRPLPKVQRIIWRMVPSAGNRRALLERGDADISYELPNKDFVELQATPASSTSCRRRSRNGIQYIGMNVTKPPFDNVKVRQAVAYAIPYQKIMDAALFGLAQADVRRARPSTPTRGRLAAAAQVQHRHRQGQAAARRGRLSQRLRDHAVVRPRLRHRQRAAVRADPGEPGADRHQDRRSTRSPAPTGARSSTRRCCRSTPTCSRAGSTTRVFLHLVLSRQELDLQHHELPVEGRWTRSSTARGAAATTGDTADLREAT